MVDTRIFYSGSVLFMGIPTEFHIIDGAEGPKDVFCSLLKYKEDMPQELFYDNTCHLSEYCLNREPALFKDTRVLA